MDPICCDTSFLFSIYRTDSNTTRALACIKRLQEPLTLSHFNEFEFEHAIHFAVWRQQLSPSQAAQALATYQTDIQAGQLIFASPNLAAIVREARRLSAQYTANEGQRSFDILHVATAVHLKASHFLSFDAKQRKLAQAGGLKLNP